MSDTTGWAPEEPEALTFRASDGDGFDPASWQATVLELMENRPIGASQTKARDRGFVFVVREPVSLQPVEALLRGSGWAGGLTARYRTGAGPFLATVLRAFVRDMISLQAGTPPSAGIVLPQPLTSAWSKRMDEVLRLLSGAGGKIIPAMVADDRPAGALQPESIEGLFHALDSVVMRSERVVLLIELANAPDDPADWDAVWRTLVGRLPERVGLVVSGMPPSWDLPGDPTQVREVASLGGVATSAPDASAFQDTLVPAGLVADRPADVDLLNVTGFATGLARFLLHPATRPMTIAVEGPWGRGKSTFLSLVERALVAPEPTPPAGAAASPGVLTVTFNAWRYRDATEIWAGLTSVITGRIEAAMPWWRRALTPLAHSWSTRRAELVGTLLVPLVAAIVLVVAALALGDGTDAIATGADGLLVPSALTIVLVVVVLYGRLRGVLAPLSEQIGGMVRRPSYADRLGFQHQVLTQLQFARGRLDGRGGEPTRRIVVFVDDLDRCPDDQIVAVLSAIHLVLGESDLFVVLGIDTAMIHRAIGRTYHDPEVRLPPNFAERYLDKVIQLSLYLPPPGTDERKAFIDSLFSVRAREELAARPGAGLGDEPSDQADSSSQAPTDPALRYDESILLSPRVQLTREIEDTADELQAFRDFAGWLGDNPRRLKRFVNAHRLVKILLQRPDAPPDVDQQRKLVKWMVFCACWPDSVAGALAAAETGTADAIGAIAIGEQDDRRRFAAAMSNADVLSSDDLRAGGLLATAAQLTRYIRDVSSDVTPRDPPDVTSQP
jgi:hypothetical protein